MTAADHPLRSALWPLGLLYGAVAALRNFAFDTGLRRSHRLAVPVVSVGNLTVGGTGKTPTVRWLCERARAAGRTPGVLARGYGRAAGQPLNDEGLMLQAALPWLHQVQDPDRVAAAARLLQLGVNFVILDDGFQHRRLQRDVDLVCLDALLPFGNGQCLPAGNLREFRSGLRRASLVLLTRAEGLQPQQLAARIERLRQLAGKPQLPVFPTSHGPRELLAMPLAKALPSTSLQGQRVVLLSAIARPQSFRATVEALGAQVVREFSFRDHHHYTAAEVAFAGKAAAVEGALLLTTAKDAPKLVAFAVPHHVLQIELQFLAGEPTDRELML